jgi:curved DNA-binding protein CbpA
VASSANRLPKLVAGIDIRGLPIGPSEAFVLSRIDGVTSESDIALATGIQLEAVSRTISRLLELGAVEVDGSGSALQRPARPAVSASGQFSVGAARVEEQVVRVEHPAAALFDPKELEEPADLDAQRKRQILELFYRMDRVSHYELLAIPAAADKRAIKARYHELINLFHPDRYFGKNLGSFKTKLERVFQGITEAHDVLVRAEARAEYDVYLATYSNARALEQVLNDDESLERELTAVQARIEEEAVSSPEQRSAPFAAAPTASVAPPAQITSIPPSDPAQSLARPDAEARRRALARKLGLSSPPPAPHVVPSPSPPPPSGGPAAHERAAQDLKRRYEKRMMDARQRQVVDYITRSEEALQNKKLVEAVNALRIAASLAPDDRELRQRLEDLQMEASRELADRYLEQAAYEEREHHWPEAARSYARALAGKPTARLHERLAFCLLAANGDLKQAVEHARKAVMGAPNDAKFRVTLARTYLAANMRESAIGELERASVLSPSDDTIKEMLRRTRRGET